MSEAEAKLKEDGLTLEKLQNLLRQGTNLIQDDTKEHGM